MPPSEFTHNQAGWDQLIKQIIDSNGVQRMTRVRDACRAQSGIEGYMLSIEGDNPLRQRDDRVTVITATWEAIEDNAAHDRLLQNFYLAEGR